MIKGNLILGIETTDGACGYFIGQEILEKKIETPDEKMAKIEAVTAADVQSVAKDILVESGLNLAVIGPADASNRLASIFRI
jgi:predicted Zn-dependent peptidase